MAITYVTLENADIYMATKLDGSQWAGITTSSAKNVYLYEASRRIANIPFINIPDVDDEGAYPQPLQDATCEEALALLTFGDNIHAQNQNMNIKSVSFGSDSVSYTEGTPKPIYSGLAMQMLNEYIQRGFDIV